MFTAVCVIAGVSSWLLVGLVGWALVFPSLLRRDLQYSGRFPQNADLVRDYLSLIPFTMVLWPILVPIVAVSERRAWHTWPKRWWARMNGRPVPEN